MKALGIMLVGALAVAGGIAAATYITKKKLERENEDNYYDDWDSDDIDDDWDFDFDEDMEVEGEPSLAKRAVDAVSEGAAIPEERSPFASDVFDEETDEDDDDEEL
ncbi:MAG: hypothetical protein J1F09_02140 [Oscillospiraceae bacterium]|nr:hypothetical protein [Oscillospiraceae bacterium]